MKKIILFGIGLTGLLIGLFNYFFEGISDVQVTYLVPEGHEGCVSIHFNQEAKKPLEIVDGELIIDLAENRGLSTSSSSEIITDLGWHTEKAYYVDEKGNRIREIDNEKFRNAIMSSTGFSSADEKYSMSFDGKTAACY